jgi:hypothetical protein
MGAGAEGPAALGQRLWAALHAEDWDRVRSLIHPDAELAGLLRRGGPLSAADAVELWRNAAGEEPWSRRPVGWVELNDNAVMLTGALASHGDHDDTEVLVLVFRDGLLWSSSSYSSWEQALARHPP